MGAGGDQTFICLPSAEKYPIGDRFGGEKRAQHFIGAAQNQLQKTRGHFLSQ